MSQPALKVIDGGLVAHPRTGEVLSPQDAQHLLDALRDEVAALTTALANVTRLNTSLRTQLDKAKEERAEEEVGEDADTIRALVRFHYSRFQRTKKAVPLSGMDAQIVIWLLRRAEMTARDVALMSVGFAANEFYREKGMVALMNCTTTKVDGKRVKDCEKAWRFRTAGAQLRGEA